MPLAERKNFSHLPSPRPPGLSLPVGGGLSALVSDTPGLGLRRVRSRMPQTRAMAVKFGDVRLASGILAC